ncbi:MAG TPA: M20/M25/M40 family metallo-hydrolase [Thermoanaerobaculia bacterium]|nr:M20/M25/M40 family metallo-hydrolase [Thermoanaerobaculia bacterium]
MTIDDAARAIRLLEELVVIPSVTGAEGPVLDFLAGRFESRGLSVESQYVSPGRRNLFVHRGSARVVFMTHADTVPPFFPPRRSGGGLSARGACDAKGSLAAQAIAFEDLVREGKEVGLLILVGEERGSDGAIAANGEPRGSRFMVCGEPTGNRFVAGSKGCLRIRVETKGEAGHSSIAGSGRSAVPPMLDFLEKLRGSEFPPDPVFGDTTMNIGILKAGTAANVIADSARAEVLFRTGESVENVLTRVRASAPPEAEFEVPYRSEPILFRIPCREQVGEIVSFACDLPLLPAWGEPILVGPGSILEAHRADEKVNLAEIEQAVGIYRTLAQGLLSEGEAYLRPRS